MTIISERLFYNHEGRDLKYRVHHIHCDGENTGIVKLQIRRGPEGTPESIHYCFHGAVYENIADATAAFKAAGCIPVKRGAKR